MYTGTTERPCCLCGDTDTVARIDVPPRAVTLMRNGGPIAWRDIVGEVALYFCESDWALVSDLVRQLGTHPLSRCNAAHASFSLREDYEALLTQTRAEPDQTELESRLLAEAATVVEGYDDDPMSEPRDLVEALVVRRALAELDVSDTDAGEG
jgi:hypothetical protein